MQSGQSKLWMQQQAEADLQALSSTATALQPLFLQIAALEPDHQTADVAVGTAADTVGSSSQASTSSQPFASPDTNAEQPCSVSEQDHLLWARCTASLRRILQTLQQKGLLGPSASMQQALAVFQSTCYAASEPHQPG